MILPEIPQTWIIFTLMLGLIILRFYGMDSFVTSAISLLIGYVTGKHIEQKTRYRVLKENK